MFSHSLFKSTFRSLLLLALAAIASLPFPARAQIEIGPPSSTRPFERVSPTPGMQRLVPLSNAGAEISLESDKPEYFLGETVVLHWRIHNAGDQRLLFDIGGGFLSPNGTAVESFHMEATNEAGEAAPDPHFHDRALANWGDVIALKPGQEYWENLPLMGYCEIDQPGAYTIKVYHDLGWGDVPPKQDFKRRGAGEIPPEPRKAPVVSTTIRFVMPTPDQARQVVEAMLAEPTRNRTEEGKKGTVPPDFRSLRYPVYLPIAKELVAKGDIRGVTMMGAMAFPEATAALLEAMESKNEAIARKGAELFRERVPQFQYLRPSRASYLAKRAWREELKYKALGTGWALLAREDRTSLTQGANLVGSYGGKDELPLLIYVMDQVMVELKDDDIEQRTYPTGEHSACEALAFASQSLLLREFPFRDELSLESPSTPGRAIVWLVALRIDDNFRPQGWQEKARDLLEHEIPFIRYWALTYQPFPLDERAIKLVAKVIEGDNALLQHAACNLARQAKLKEFGPPLMDLLKKSENRSLMSEAFSAARQCGASKDRCLEIAVRRLGTDDNTWFGWNHSIFNLLIKETLGDVQCTFERTNEAPDYGPPLQTSWLEFIDLHREQLRAGKTIHPSDSSVTPDLLPAGFTLSWEDDRGSGSKSRRGRPAPLRVHQRHSPIHPEKVAPRSKR